MQEKLVKLYSPRSLSLQRLDRYLANGWFRSGNMLYRSQLICIDETIYSTVNIRLKLADYFPKKRHRKIIRKCEELFTVKIAKIKIDPAVDLLYKMHMNRFKGFLIYDLEQYFLGGAENSIFTTYQVSVFKDNELVAASFFDLGKETISSQLCVYSDEYPTYSLGIFTMLCELKFAKENGYRWYYPGYVLDSTSSFDYKLSVGTFNYYNWDGQWKPYTRKETDGIIGPEIRAKKEEIADFLKQAGIQYESYYYPLFSFGYLQFEEDTFMQNPFFFFLQRSERSAFMLEYNLETKLYRFCAVELCPEYETYFNIHFSMDFINSSLYFKELIKYREIIKESTSIDSLLTGVLDAIKVN